MKSYIMLAEGFEEIEAVSVYDILKRSGLTVLFVSVTDTYEVESSRGMKLKCDTLLNTLSISKNDCIILPGGMPGTRNLQKCNALSEILVQHANDFGLTCAICAAPLVIGRLGLLKNYKATCYPGFEKDLLEADIVSDAVVADRNIITSRGPGTAISFALTIAETLAGKEISDRIAEDMLVV